MARPIRDDTPAMQVHRSVGGLRLALIGLTVASPVSGRFDRWARGSGGDIARRAAPMPIPGGHVWGEAHEVLAHLLPGGERGTWGGITLAPFRAQDRVG